MNHSGIVAVKKNNKDRPPSSAVFSGAGHILKDNSAKKAELLPSGDFGDNLSWEDEQEIRRVLAENNGDNSQFIHLSDWSPPCDNLQKPPAFDDFDCISGEVGDGLTWEDEQAIRQILAENEEDDVGFASSLSNLPLLPNHQVDPSADQPSTTKGSVVPRELPDEKRRPGMSLVDPEWETIDPNPDIYALFHQFSQEFFGGKLTSVEVKWSKQMTS